MTDEGTPTWCAGIVNHGGYDDLRRNLETLQKQILPAALIAVYDTGLDPKAFQQLVDDYPSVRFELGANRGFAGGANRVLEIATSDSDLPAYCLLLNSDIELDPDFAALLVQSMQERPEVAIAGGKLLRPDRKTIDSAGIVFPPNGRPRDRGSEELDEGQFDHPAHVAGISGAAMMLRTSAIPSLSLDSELFDESFFAYHEDTDLCWRARRFGWKIFYEPNAVALHARGWQKDKRAEIKTSIRQHSFKNHYLQLVKNETRTSLLGHLPWLVLWEGLRLGYAVLRDRPMLGAYRQAWQALPEARRKRLIIQQRAGDPRFGPPALEQA